VLYNQQTISENTMKTGLIYIIFAVLLASTPTTMAKSANKHSQQKGSIHIAKHIDNATWYDYPNHPKRITANGERFLAKKFTCAVTNRKMMNHYVRVTLDRKNIGYSNTVLVWANDMLPKGSKATIDLSRGAAEYLHMIRSGRVPIKNVIVYPNKLEPINELQCLTEHADSITKTRATANINGLNYHP
jgi:rare lipoprotein A (peptidoglycan hydrolase)